MKKVNVDRVKQLEKQKKNCWLNGAIFGVCFIVVKHILQCWDSAINSFDFSQFLAGFNYKDLIALVIASAVYAIILRSLATSELKKIQKGFESKTKRK